MYRGNAGLRPRVVRRHDSAGLYARSAGSGEGRLGDSVTVEGTLGGGTIHVSSLRMFSEVGLRTGQRAPDFSCVDQFGKTQTLETLRGRNGTVLLFCRSADWCPYCKGQLIQLQAAKGRFEKQGLKVAGISSDNVEILKYFAGRRKIEFPLLSDFRIPISSACIRC